MGSGRRGYAGAPTSHEKGTGDDQMNRMWALQSGELLPSRGAGIVYTSHYNVLGPLTTPDNAYALMTRRLDTRQHCQ